MTLLLRILFADVNHYTFFFHPFSPHFTYYNFKLTLIHSPLLIFNQPSLLITFFHTFTITFAFFTPFSKFKTFSLFFSALQRIRTRLSLLSTPLIHCQPL